MRTLLRSRDAVAACRRLSAFLLVALLLGAPAALAASQEVHERWPTPWGDVEAHARCAPGQTPGAPCRVVVRREGAYEDRAEVAAGGRPDVSVGSCRAGTRCETLGCDAAGCAYWSGERAGPYHVAGSVDAASSRSCLGGVAAVPWCAWTRVAAGEACAGVDQAGWKPKTCLYTPAALP